MRRLIKWLLMGVGGFVVLLMVLVIIGVLVGPSTSRPSPEASVDTPQPSTPSTAPAPQWQEVKRWRGSGMKDTETFTTNSREWRITWKTSNEVFAGAGILQIFVHDSNDRMVSLVANKQGTDSDTTYVRSIPGPHYLKINSGNVDWDVLVEEQR